MAFIQASPALVNQYTDDRVLRSYLARALDAGVLTEIEPELHTLGELAEGSFIACSSPTVATSRC